MEAEKKWENKFIELETRYKTLETRFLKLFEDFEREKRYNDSLFHELMLAQRDVIDCKSELNQYKKGSEVQVMEHDG